ncbi:MAG: hypothetical protein Q9184_008276, partial [Pyrenodesmia sp. 2 TL-2023]
YLSGPGTLPRPLSHLPPRRNPVEDEHDHHPPPRQAGHPGTHFRGRGEPSGGVTTTPGIPHDRLHHWLDHRGTS